MSWIIFLLVYLPWLKSDTSFITKYLEWILFVEVMKKRQYSYCLVLTISFCRFQCHQTVGTQRGCRLTAATDRSCSTETGTSGEHLLDLFACVLLPVVFFISHHHCSSPFGLFLTLNDCHLDNSYQFPLFT